jgi:hypothetical protein
MPAEPPMSSTAPTRIDVTRLARRRQHVYRSYLFLKYLGWIPGLALCFPFGAFIVWPLTSRLASRMRAGGRKATVGAAVLAAVCLALAVVTAAWGMIPDFSATLPAILALVYALAGLAIGWGPAALLWPRGALRADGIADDVPIAEVDQKFVNDQRFGGLKRDRTELFLSRLVPEVGSLIFPSTRHEITFEDKQWYARQVHKLRRYDKREPILHLRSFESDHIAVAGMAARHFSSLGKLYLDDVVGETLFRYGPVVAAFAPGDRHQPLGVARAKLGDDWQQQVLTWLSESRAVSITLGSTPGLLWELAVVAESGALEKTLIVLPPGAGSGPWRKFRDALEPAAVLPDESELERARVVIPGDAARAPVIITSSGAGDYDYGAALDAAWSVLEHARKRALAVR